MLFTVHVQLKSQVSVNSRLWQLTVYMVFRCNRGSVRLVGAGREKSRIQVFLNNLLLFHIKVVQQVLKSQCPRRPQGLTLQTFPRPLSIKVGDIMLDVVSVIVHAILYCSQGFISRCHMAEILNPPPGILNAEYSSSTFSVTFNTFLRQLIWYSCDCQGV